MPVPRTLFEEMTPSAPTMGDKVPSLSHCLALSCVIRLMLIDSRAYWDNEGDLAAMIFGGGFFGEGGIGTGTQDPGTEMQDQWANTLDGTNIDGE
jgi:hypothetical protein